MDDSLYDDKDEHASHLNAIHLLETEAPEYGVDKTIIQTLYEAELTNLKITARIKTFLSVLAMRRVRNVLKFIKYVHNGFDPVVAAEKYLAHDYERTLLDSLELFYGGNKPEVSTIASKPLKSAF